MNKIFLRRIFIFLFVLPLFILFVFFIKNYLDKVNSLSTVLVDKEKLVIHMINVMGDTLHTFPIAVGTNFGNKQKVGDLKTPEGTFPVKSIENSTTWTYDFENDDKGPIEGAYGPWFIRLEVKGSKGIGIHGTHQNETIGKRVSHGCVRMKNENLMVLVKLIKPGIQVTITNDKIEKK